MQNLQAKVSEKSPRQRCRRAFSFLEPTMPVKPMPFKPCPGCPMPAKCKAAGKCKKTAR